MRHSMEVGSEAARYFDLGFAEASASKALGVSESIVKKWLYTYRALGNEALLVTEHRKCDHETKVGAARAVIEGRTTKPEACAAVTIP